MAQITIPKQIIFYQDAIGHEPFNDWLDSLRDPKTRRRILSRFLRIQSGNFGDCKSLKDGVFELRIPYGPGYRVYFGEDGDTLVVVLCGGDKSSQTQDIKTAKAYWKEYIGHA
jgi:putative addiction module killer protein